MVGEMWVYVYVSMDESACKYVRVSVIQWETWLSRELHSIMLQISWLSALQWKCASEHVN